MNRRIALVAMATVALAASGCGSTGSSTTKTSTTAFTTKADATCLSFLTAASEEPTSGGAASIRSTATFLSQGFTKLAALSPPADRAAAVKAVISDGRSVASNEYQLAAAVTALNRAAAAKNGALLARDRSRMSRIEAQANANTARTHTAADAAGIKGCG